MMKHEDKWILDSGATCHISNRREFFDTLDETVLEAVWVANGMKAESKGRGSGKIVVLDGAGNRRVIMLEAVLYVPDMKSNLISVKRLVKKGFSVTFDETGAKIVRGRTISAVVEFERGLFVMKQCNESASLVTSASECIHVWHRRLGHRDCDAVLKLKDLALGVSVKACSCKEICEACIQGKMNRSPFPKTSESQTSAVMDLVHTDICEPMRTSTIGGRKYFLTVIDTADTR